MADRSPAPDYADPACWERLAAGESPSATSADLFYLHPTTHAGPSLNQTLDDPPTSAHSAVVARQTAAFGRTCRVFAPRYRQVSLRGFREPGPGAAHAYERAYADIQAAFRYYLRHHAGGRVFALAGHSQGALHASRLLRDIVEREGLDCALIAAYLVGIGISEGLFGTVFRRVVPCERPDQTGCVVSWNSFLDAPDSDPASFFGRTAARDSTLLDGNAPGPPICINPISFDKARPVFAASDNPGSLHGSDPPVLESGLAGARDRDGVAWVALAPAALAAFPPLAGGNLHMHDIDLFHAALGTDIARRARAHAGFGL